MRPIEDYRWFKRNSRPWTGWHRPHNNYKELPRLIRKVSKRGEVHYINSE